MHFLKYFEVDYIYFTVMDMRSKCEYDLYFKAYLSSLSRK